MSKKTLEERIADLESLTNALVEARLASTAVLANLLVQLAQKVRDNDYEVGAIVASADRLSAACETDFNRHLATKEEGSDGI